MNVRRGSSIGRSRALRVGSGTLLAEPPLGIDLVKYKRGEECYLCVISTLILLTSLFLLVFSVGFFVCCFSSCRYDEKWFSAHREIVPSNCSER